MHPAVRRLRTEVTVMYSDTPSECGRNIADTRRKRQGSRTSIRVIARFTIAVGALACFGWQGLWASGPDTPVGGLIVQRSARAMPRKFTVYPNGATIAANQSQRFAVVDAEGKAVAVRWNVSGIGCSGSACGTIDDEGIYHPPTSLPQPRIVTLEGVLISDPNYSVLTEVRLEKAVIASSAPAPTALAKMQQLTAPVIGSLKAGRRADPLPLLAAVGAAPVVEERDLGRSIVLPPLPNVVSAAPVIGSGNAGRRVESPPQPVVIAAPPMLGGRNVVRSAELLPLPGAVAAAPVIGRDKARSAESKSPLTVVIMAAPVLEGRNVVRSGELPPLPGAVAAAPAVKKRDLGPSAALPSPQPEVIAAAPVVERKGAARSIDLLPLPNSVAAAPVPEKANAARDVAPSPAPVVVASVSPTSTQIFPGSPQSTPTPVAGVRNSTTGEPLPRPGMVGSTSVTSAVAEQGGPVVTYQNGQLTINAENSTLATVLALVAEKTGAVIDVPPGSGLDRIVEHAGPGRAEDVLAQLLNGSPFDFVIVGSLEHPRDPAQVLLFPHQAETSASLQPPSPSVDTAPPSVQPPAAVALAPTAQTAPTAQAAQPQPHGHGLPQEILDKLFSRKPPPEQQ